MSDREIIIRLLKHIQKRKRFSHAVNELTTALSISFFILILLKIWDLVATLDGFTIAAALGLAAAGSVLFSVPRVSRSASTLHEIAAAIDRQGNLHDEIKSAYWFLRTIPAILAMDRCSDRARGTNRSCYSD